MHERRALTPPTANSSGSKSAADTAGANKISATSRDKQKPNRRCMNLQTTTSAKCFSKLSARVTCKTFYLVQCHHRRRIHCGKK